MGHDFGVRAKPTPFISQEIDNGVWHSREVEDALELRYSRLYGRYETYAT